MALSRAMEHGKIMRGAFGHLIIDGEEIASCKALKANIEIDTEAIYLPDQILTDNVITGANGKGSITLFKIDSYFHKLIGDRIKTGEQMVFTIVSRLSDPAAWGSETVSLEGVVFTNLNLADWERGKNTELEVNFVFSGYEQIDLV